ncbi:hypothetical protein BOX15_Mlig028677g1 [Macrostomum lignano]|uniref:Uncharacterized protein n=1 Tax=Macrostomum lignano TaxID=282301 RepID=A0A267GNM1_9PLAT|nr:hypothetical protein BOX15_Mlig028677g1 [Macrostomum lignano]
MAVPQFNVKLLNLLTDRLGVDIDAIDPADGETWLTRATTGGHLGLVQFLLSAGASPDKRNAAGDSAETLAARDIKMSCSLCSSWSCSTLPRRSFGRHPRQARHRPV